MAQVLACAPLGVLVTFRRFARVLPASLPEDLPRIWIEEEVPPESPLYHSPSQTRCAWAHLPFTSSTRTDIPRIVATDHLGSMLSHAWRPQLWPFDPARDVVGCSIFDPGTWSRRC